jgi:hypothetical protein
MRERALHAAVLSGTALRLSLVQMSSKGSARRESDLGQEGNRLI